MKLGLTEYGYTHNKYLTYAENIADEIYGHVGVYPKGLVKSDNVTVTGTLKDITLFESPTDDDSYIEIPQNEYIELTFKNSESSIGSVGSFSDAAPITTAGFRITTVGEVNGLEITVQYYNAIGGTYYDDTIGVSSLKVTQFDSWAAGSTLIYQDYAVGKLKITNSSSTNNYIRIYDVSFEITDTIKVGVQTQAVYSSKGKAVTTPTVEFVNLVPRFLTPNKKDITWDGDNILATLNGGRLYERWVDSVSSSARSNGLDADDIILSPAGQVESILRDEIFTERDLTITGLGGGVDDLFALNDLRSVVADYYNYAIIYNVTRNEKDYIIDSYYGGGNKVVQTSTDHAAWDVNDKCFIINIQGDNKINYASFDLLNNASDGTRKDWRFTRTLHQEEHPSGILEKLLYEMRSILFTSHNQYKIVALDEASSADTWTEPLKQGGRYLFSSSLTSLDQLFNDYKINYDYDYGSGEYRKSLFVNKNGYSSELTNGATYQATCKDIFDDYKRINKFEYYCDWIKSNAYDTGSYRYWTTAEYFFDKIFAWHSIQRMIVNWAAPVSDYLQYEVGDQVILNNTKLIPTGINNSSKFMIFENPIIPLPGAPLINFKLIEMTDA